ncbi:MAG: twin-arginine translocase TatA/TatE family subunit [Deltaproteobacteria bacterium]|nr:twin-arginine translocase TatA/TatE family subunit [Deltaproteobacteria bacterium]
MPGMMELVVILLIVLVVFGANKLPGIGDALGRSIRNFKKASSPALEGEEVVDTKAVPAAGNGKKQVAGAKQKQLDAGGEDEEWEEVVVRRKKNKKEADA